MIHMIHIYYSVYTYAWVNGNDLTVLLHWNHCFFVGKSSPCMALIHDSDLLSFTQKKRGFTLWSINIVPAHHPF